MGCFLDVSGGYHTSTEADDAHSLVAQIVALRERNARLQVHLPSMSTQTQVRVQLVVAVLESSTHSTTTQLNSTQLNSTQLNSTQLNSTQLNSTQLKLNSTQLNSTQLNSTQLNSTQLNYCAHAGSSVCCRRETQNKHTLGERRVVVTLTKRSCHRKVPNHKRQQGGHPPIYQDRVRSGGSAAEWPALGVAELLPGWWGGQQN